MSAGRTPASSEQQSLELEHRVPMHAPPASDCPPRANVRTAVPFEKEGPAGKFRITVESVAVYVPWAPKRMPELEGPHTRRRDSALPDTEATSVYRVVGALSK
jgi:hypothetical protein